MKTWRFRGGSSSSCTTPPARCFDAAFVSLLSCCWCRSSCCRCTCICPAAFIRPCVRMRACACVRARAYVTHVTHITSGSIEPAPPGCTAAALGGGPTPHAARPAAHLTRSLSLFCPSSSCGAVVIVSLGVAPGAFVIQGWYRRRRRSTLHSIDSRGESDDPLGSACLVLAFICSGGGVSYLPADSQYRRNSSTSRPSPASPGCFRPLVLGPFDGV